MTDFYFERVMVMKRVLVGGLLCGVSSAVWAVDSGGGDLLLKFLGELLLGLLFGAVSLLSILIFSLFACFSFFLMLYRFMRDRQRSDYLLSILATVAMGLATMAVLGFNQSGIRAGFVVGLFGAYTGGAILLTKNHHWLVRLLLLLLSLLAAGAAYFFTHLE